MEISKLRRLLVSDAEAILDRLSTEQYVKPHQSLRDGLKKSASECGFSQSAGERAAQWLGLDLETRIGRLRRTELAQLARSTFRFTRQNTPSSEAVPQPMA